MLSMVKYCMAVTNIMRLHNGNRVSEYIVARSILLHTKPCIIIALSWNSRAITNVVNIMLYVT